VDARSEDTPEVLVVAEDPIVRSALLGLLSGQSFEVQGASPAAVDEAQADVLVWDLGSDARIAVDRLRELEDAGAQVIALLPSGAPAAAAFAAGAHGLLLREGASARVLSAAVNAVQAGLVVVDPALASSVMPTRDRTPLAEELTAREQQVLQHLSEGLANKEIAAKMHISDHTVKFHVNAILAKLGVTSRTEAVVQAAKRGLVIL